MLWEIPPARRQALDEIAAHLHRTLVARPEMQELPHLAPERQQATLLRWVEAVAPHQVRDVLTHREQAYIASVLQARCVGAGPIQPLLDDPGITEVMVNGPDEIFVERAGGQTERADCRFAGEEELLHVIDRIVSRVGRRIDESSPMVDARLPDGSRVNAIIPPLSLKGPVVTVRRFPPVPFRLEDLVTRGALPGEMALFIRAAVRGRLNIAFGGGTGSGKTTLMCAALQEVPAQQRMIVIEDLAELPFDRPNLIRLEARPANAEGRGEVTLRQLVRNALRMRPDRIVVGEVRGPEALDMLQAMNTGHEGSMTTGHANTPADLLSRLESMVAMAGLELPLQAVRQQIASALQVVVHLSRFPDGSRRVTDLCEVLGLQDGAIQLAPIWTFRQEGTSEDGAPLGHYERRPTAPACWQRLQARGVTAGMQGWWSP